MEKSIQKISGKNIKFRGFVLSMWSELVGKRVAFVTAGYPTKRFIYERAKDNGVFVILLDSKDSWSRSVAEYLRVLISMEEIQ